MTEPRDSYSPERRTALLFTGTSAVNVFHDNGVRCAGGTVIRRQVTISSAIGSAVWGPGLTALIGWSSGQTYVVQVWNRDNGGLCGHSSNFTSAIQVTLQP